MAQVKVYVTLKPSLLDAQGKVVQSALQHLGFDGVGDVRVGKLVELSVPDTADTDAQVRAMCEKLLANPVIEDFRYEITKGTPTGDALAEWDDLLAAGIGETGL